MKEREGTQMIGSLNKVMLIGRIGRTPQPRETSDGLLSCALPLAVNRTWKTDTGEVKQDTEWITVYAHDRLATLCAQSATKGRLLYVEGRLATRTKQDKSGAAVQRVVVIAEEITFLENRWQVIQEQRAEPQESREVTLPLPF